MKIRKARLKIRWKSDENQKSFSKNQMKIRWKSEKLSLKIRWKSDENQKAFSKNQMEIRWKSDENQTNQSFWWDELPVLALYTTNPVTSAIVNKLLFQFCFSYKTFREKMFHMKNVKLPNSSRTLPATFALLGCTRTLFISILHGRI